MVARVGIEKCRIQRDFACNASAASGSYPESYPAIFLALSAPLQTLPGWRQVRHTKPIRPVHSPLILISAPGHRAGPSDLHGSGKELHDFRLAHVIEIIWHADVSIEEPEPLGLCPFGGIQGDDLDQRLTGLGNDE